MTTIPHGHTARRLEWKFLPASVRELVEGRCGSRVVSASSQDAGFTPGFASVLTCADGSRHFVKAASVKAQPASAAAYGEEARKLALLPEGVLAPRLRWSHADGEWVVLGIEHVDGRLPRRPWRPTELRRCLAAVEAMTRAVTPAPAPLAADTFADEFGPLAESWAHLAATHHGLPHLAEAAALAAHAAEAGTGDSLVHTDLRDDNLLLGRDGRVWICDWNWTVVGAPWVDTVFLLVQAAGDGLDADALLASLPLTREVAAHDIDSLLALMVGFLFRQRQQPVPATSPHLRDHQSWTGEAAWAWLGRRRGW